MSMLQSVRDQMALLTGKPKAISHNPHLDGREHVYRQGGEIGRAHV